MAKKTAAGVLGKIENPDVPSESQRGSVNIDPARSRAFAPTVVLDLTKIEAPGLDTLYPTGGLVRDAFVTRRQKEYRRKIQGGWKGLKLVSEGDSWFQYPIYVNDIIYWLNQHYAIFDFAAAGDTLSNMKLGIGRIIDVIQQEQSNGFLISGGGNDLLDRGSLRMLLRPYNRTFTKAEQYLIKHRLEEKLGDLDNLQAGGMLADYNDFFSALTQRFPSLSIFCHGYDWMLPGFDGIYLWPIMQEREIPEKLRAEVIKLIVDRFNDRLKTLADRYGGQVIYVDCRGAVGGKSNWFDEIHPGSKGFRRVADRFRNAIENAIGHIA